MLTKETTGRYISILADGKFHETVEQGADGAVLRQYETSDGKKGEKWELVYTKIEAPITKIEFHEGDYGENIQITFTDTDGEVTLSQGTATNFGEDILKKLPNIDFTKKATFAPYAFTAEDEKLKKGVTIYQEGEKVLNYFYKDDKVANGYPSPEGDTEKYQKDDWKVYFILARKFLVNYTKENIVSKFQAPLPPKMDYPRDALDPKEIPF